MQKLFNLYYLRFKKVKFLESRRQKIKNITANEISKLKIKGQVRFKS